MLYEPPVSIFIAVEAREHERCARGHGVHEVVNGVVVVGMVLLLLLVLSCCCSIISTSIVMMMMMMRGRRRIGCCNGPGVGAVVERVAVGAERVGLGILVVLDAAVVGDAMAYEVGGQMGVGAWHLHDMLHQNA